MRILLRKPTTNIFAIIIEREGAGIQHRWISEDLGPPSFHNKKEGASGGTYGSPEPSCHNKDYRVFSFRNIQWVRLYNRLDHGSRLLLHFPVKT